MTNHLGENEFRNLAQLNLGEALSYAGREPEAVWHLAEAEQRRELWIFPFDFQRRAVSHGNACLNLGQWEAAVVEYGKALSINPGNVAARNIMALALWKNGQLADAIRELRESIRWQPDRGDSHFNLGAILIDANRNEAAIGFLNEALRLGVDQTLVNAKLAEARQ